MWSVFNEEPMQGTAGGYEMVRRMREVVRDLDTSRPVTAAMNDGLFTPLNVSHALDVLGFNYQQDQYDAVHAARPWLPLMSSEDTSAFMLRGYYGPRDDKRHLIPSYDDDAAPGAPRTARPGRPLPSGPSSPAALSGRALTITASPRPTSGRPTARCSASWTCAASRDRLPHPPGAVGARPPRARPRAALELARPRRPARQGDGVQQPRRGGLELNGRLLSAASRWTAGP